MKGSRAKLLVIFVYANEYFYKAGGYRYFRIREIELLYSNNQYYRFPDVDTLPDTNEVWGHLDQWARSKLDWIKLKKHEFNKGKFESLRTYCARNKVRIEVSIHQVTKRRDL